MISQRDRLFLFPGLDTACFSCYVIENQKRKGTVMKKRILNFTLVEILTVVAIIGILAGIGLGVTSYVTNKNREVQTQTTIKMLEMILSQYKNKYGGYPALNGKPVNSLGQAVFKLPLEPGNNHPLVALFHDVSYNNNEIAGIKGLNIKITGSDVLILDGWGSPIVYVYPGVFNKKSFDLGSAGPNKMLGENSAYKFSSTEIPSGLTRDKTNAYRDTFGTVDDITNFKR